MQSCEALNETRLKLPTYSFYINSRLNHIFKLSFLIDSLIALIYQEAMDSDLFELQMILKSTYGIV